ncbi:MAG: beta-propeller fold lactonase family protein [Actinomycetota bacterium]
MFRGTVGGTVYIQTNEPENRVVAFARARDGTLTELGSYATGGAGDGKAHLTSQGSVLLSGDGRYLLVTNVASDEVSVLRVDGAEPELIQTVASGGVAPKSLAEREGIVYVLNTGTPSVCGFRLSDAGLEPFTDADRQLPAESAEAAQVGFTPDGSMIVITERATDSIITFAIGSEGRLGEMEVTPSRGPTPYGFAFTSGGMLVVTEAFRAGKGDAAVSSYAVRGRSLSPVSASVGNGRSEICWAVVTDDDRFAFTTNFADGAVSRYAIGTDGVLTLEDATAALTEDGRPGLRDEALTRDGRFLYAIDADSGSIFGWEVGQGGSLAPIGSWGGLPVTVAGLAAL